MLEVDDEDLMSRNEMIRIVILESILLKIKFKNSKNY